jgi:hypothetical protein
MTALNLTSSTWEANLTDAIESVTGLIDCDGELSLSAQRLAIGTGNYQG